MKQVKILMLSLLVMILHLSSVEAKLGTDIFVLGFEKDPDWMEQSAISVIEYFFYSIFKGNLEVTVVEGDKSITITQKTLVI